MNRLFGTRSTAPKPTLTSAISTIDERVSSITVKITALNTELATYTERLQRTRAGTPGHTALKQKALKVLQRRKAFEAQRERLEGQVWNMEQAQDMRDNLTNVAATVDALDQSNRELRKTYGKIDLDKIERLQDEMADLLDVGNEIQESLSRGYDVPEDVDEQELDAELEALGVEMEMEREQQQQYGGMAGNVPSFLMDEVPEFVDERGKEKGVQQAAG